MANKISMLLQTPADSLGKRTDIHPITTTDEVIVDSTSSSSKTLTKKLDEISVIQVQSSQPSYPCIWAKPDTWKS